jgi:hypothetical protein
MSSKKQLVQRMVVLEERYQRRPRPKLDLSALTDAELDRLEALAERYQQGSGDAGRVSELTAQELAWLDSVAERVTV